MANRRYRSQFLYSMVGMRVTVDAQINFAAAGAPTIATGSSLISSVVRNSAGDYTITFKDVYKSLLGIKHTFNSGNAAPTAPGMYIKNDSIAVLAAPTIRVVFNAAGTATDPASGEKVLLNFYLNNSTVTW